MTFSTESPTGSVGTTGCEQGLGLMCRLMVAGLLLGSRSVFHVDTGHSKRLMTFDISGGFLGCHLSRSIRT